MILCCVGGNAFSSGYLIPKGWKVLPLFRNIHHSPDNFKEPEKFDPSRFEVSIMQRKELMHYCPCSYVIVLNNFARWLQSPILLCHLAMGPMHVRAMK